MAAGHRRALTACVVRLTLHPLAGEGVGRRFCSHFHLRLGRGVGDQARGGGEVLRAFSNRPSGA